MELFKKLFSKKLSKKESKLLEDFEKGRILQIDNNINNKEYLKQKL